jgi:hypothetical protein
MSFILSEQRDADVGAAFMRYRSYLASEKSSFPPSAYALATSDWYFNFQDHRCPHDSWLHRISISESSVGERHEERKVSIIVTLLGPYHDKRRVFEYPTVYSYRLAHDNVRQGHRDWRYDEFRVSAAGHLVHEIEWHDLGEAGSWVIVADDVRFEVLDT